MSTSVVLPALGESVTEGTVTRWLKNVGDTVVEDEGLLEVSTDKVDTEIPSPVSGVIEEIFVSEDETIEVGAILVRIGDGSGIASAAPAAPAASAPEPAPAATAPAATPQAGAASGTDILLPELGESVTEGTVTRWLKNIGDTVELDEPLLEISTDKVDTEIPAPVAGVLLEVLAAEDETVAVGSVLARIGDASALNSAPEPAPAAVQEPVQAPAAPAPAAAATDSADSLSNDASNYVTPLVRKLAQEHGVDLKNLTGTGVGGRIRKEDILEAAKKAATPAAPAATPAAAAPVKAEKAAPSELRGTTVPMSRLRKVLASRAVASMQETAQLTTVVEVDVTALSNFRDSVKNEFFAKTGNKLSFLPFFALTAAEALQQFPIVNATVDGDQIVYPAHENISIAVDTERGLLTPVLRDAANKSLSEISADIADLAARTRDNKLKPDELAGGTFTLTNTGSRGALFDTPVVFLPQSAILGTGVVFKRPGVVTVDGKDAISVRSYVFLALSYDHRIIDGADAARFLGFMKKRLEDANFSADLGVTL